MALKGRMAMAILSIQIPSLCKQMLWETQGKSPRGTGAFFKFKDPK
jgi:hypothetical protein